MTYIRGRSRKVCIVLTFVDVRLSHSYALALNDRLNRLPPVPSPSDIVHSASNLADLFGVDEPPIHLGRPGGAPATIFNPVLAKLQQRLDHLDQVQASRPEVDLAAKYVRSTVTFYKDESTRQNAIKGIVDEAIDENGRWTQTLGWADSIKPDCCWWHDVFLIVVLELKNTLGLSGDALFQAIIDYGKIVCRERVRCHVSAALNPWLTFVYSTSPSGGSVTFPSSSLAPLQIVSKFPSPFA